jgi:hypothetical protein
VVVRGWDFLQSRFFFRMELMQRGPANCLSVRLRRYQVGFGGLQYCHSLLRLNGFSSLRINTLHVCFISPEPAVVTQTSLVDVRKSCHYHPALFGML